MRNTQEILTAVVESGIYAGSWQDSEFMCKALTMAYQAGYITSGERWAALDAIDEYIKKLRPRSLSSSDVMCWALQHAGVIRQGHGGAYNWARSQGRDFYLNWDTRPQPWENYSASTNVPAATEL